MIGKTFVLLSLPLAIFGLGVQLDTMDGTMKEGEARDIKCTAEGWEDHMSLQWLLGGEGLSGSNFISSPLTEEENTVEKKLNFHKTRVSLTVRVNASLEDHGKVLTCRLSGTNRKDWKEASIQLNIQPKNETSTKSSAGQTRNEAAPIMMTFTFLLSVTSFLLSPN